MTGLGLAQAKNVVKRTSEPTSQWGVIAIHCPPRALSGGCASAPRLSPGAVLKGRRTCGTDSGGAALAGLEFEADFRLAFALGRMGNTTSVIGTQERMEDHPEDDCSRHRGSSLTPPRPQRASGGRLSGASILRGPHPHDIGSASAHSGTAPYGSRRNVQCPRHESSGVCWL